MKKIYMIMAAIALLSLSLNAQTMTADHSNCQVNSLQAKGLSIHSSSNNSTTSSKHSFINLLRSTKGVSTIMPQLYDGTPVQGLLRAPLRLNSDEVTVGPFTGDNFDNGVGFGNAYSSPQEIFIETDLVRNEYADHIGDDIIGFRLALYGDGSQTVNVGEFMAWPGNSDGNFDQDHLYTWSIGELTSNVGDPYYEKVTSTADLESGAEYLIVCENYNVAFNGSLTGTNIDGNNNYISVSPSNGIIASNATTDAATFTITANGNYYTIKNKSGYYIGRTQNSNGINYSTSTQYNNTITISNGNASIRCSASTARYLRYYNSTSDHRFRYYQTSTGQIVQLYKKVTPTVPAYVALQDGQWHEFYLDEPVPFVVGDDNASLSLGYTYIQYPTGTTGQNLFPIAVNSESTTHAHYAYLTVESQSSGGTGDITITVSNAFNIDFYQIVVYDNDTGNPVTYWQSSGTTYTTSEGYTAYDLPSGWSLDGASYLLQETVSGYDLAYLSVNSSASIVISNSALNGATNVSVQLVAVGWSSSGQTITINGDSQSIEYQSLAQYTWNPVDLGGGGGGTTTNTGWYQQDFSQYGDLAVQLIFKSKKQTPEAPTVTNQVNDDNVVITITPDPNTDGQLVYYVIDQNGQQTTDLVFPRGETDYVVTVHAYTTDTDNYFESPEAVVEVTIPHLQTAAPVITYEVVGDNVVITATGDGTVTLTVGDETVSGNGSASVTVPRHMFDYNVTATATAKESNKAISETTTEEITIPGTGGEGWLLMDGTYTGNEALSFIDEATQKPIVFVDQFIGQTLYNQHPDKYEYVLKEEATGETSSTVPVTVYKTSSTLKGLYTKEEVDGDTDRELVANVVNGTMVYDIQTDNNMYYYGLYRGERNADYPVVDLNHHISMLQQSDETVSGEVVHFFNESFNNDVLPHYDHQSDGIVERVDKEFITGVEGNWIDYVPVIWTFGYNTGRTDGKNNTYGSDIKRTYLGGVDAQITGTKSDYHPQHWGEWTDPATGIVYCVYTPVITIFGSTPDNQTAHDGDQYTYVPYMYRVWCLYEGAHDFVHNSDGQLTDNGPMTAPFLLGENQIESETATIGGPWEIGSERLPWAFGVPVSENSSNVTFAIRFYYKKMVTEGGTTNSLRGNRDGEDGYMVVEMTGNGEDIETAINEMYSGKMIVGVTYVNAQGMQSDKPFDGLNIVVTRYSDGTTITTKVMR